MVNEGRVIFPYTPGVDERYSSTLALDRILICATTLQTIAIPHTNILQTPSATMSGVIRQLVDHAVLFFADITNEIIICR